MSTPPFAAFPSQWMKHGALLRNEYLRPKRSGLKHGGLKHGCFSQSIGFWLVVVSISQKLLDLQLQSHFMTARDNSRMHFPFFCKSLSECEYTFGITITVLKISQNNDNRGCHLEFYSQTGIGNWFQCFPVYPGLNLSSGSGFGFWIPAFPYAHLGTSHFADCTRTFTFI